MTHSITSLFISASLMATMLWAQTPVQTMNVTPNEVESGKAFQIELTGMTTLCNPQFSMHQASVDKGSIYLSVVAANDPLAKCTSGDHAYKTDFDLPALKAGEYAVTASLEPTCRYTTPACLLPVLIEGAGTLSVKDSASLYFAIRPDIVEAGKAFDMLLTQKGWSCANQFSNPMVEVSGHTIFVQVTERVNYLIDCAPILRDYGPSLKMPALTKGTYQIRARTVPYCGPNTPCRYLFIDYALSGALTVTASSSVIHTHRTRQEMQRSKLSPLGLIDAIHNVLGRSVGGRR